MLGLTPRRIRAFTLFSLLMALLVAALVLYAHHLIQKPSVQKALLERLSSDTGFRVRTGRIELSLWGGIGLRARRFEAADREGAGRIEADSLHVVLNPGALLQGRVLPERLTLVRPRIELEAPDGEQGKRPPVPWLPGLESLSVESGSVAFRNRPYRIESLSLNVRSDEGDPVSLKVTALGRVLFRDRAIPFRTHGTLVRPVPGEGAGPFALQASFEGVPLVWLPWPEKIAFEDGVVSARFSVEGVADQPVRASGQVTASHVRFVLRDGAQVKSYAPPEIHIHFRGDAERTRVSLPELSLRTGDLALKLELDLDLPDGASPRLRMHVKGEPMPFELMERYFPTPLLAPWVENRLFPLLQRGSVRLEHLTLNGSIEEIDSLDEPEHAGALSLAAACGDFVVSGNAIPRPLRRVSARVTYQEGDLKITGLQGSLGDSTIREGRLEIRRILDDHPFWDILVDGDFGLETLLEQREIEFIPPDALRVLTRVGPMTGRLSCRAWFHYENGWAFPRTRQGLFVLHDTLIRQPELRLPLRLDKAQIRVLEKEENRFQASGAWGGSRFEAAGHFGAGRHAFPLQSADVVAWMDMNEALPVLLRGFELPLAFDGPVATRFSLTREKDRWRSRGRLDLEEVTLRNDQVSMHPPGAEDHIAFDLFVGPGEHLSLEKVLCRFRGSVLELSGGYDLERKDLFTLEVSAPALDLEDLGLRFRDHGAPSRGSLQGRLKILASREDPMATMILGDVQGSAISAQLHRIPSPIQDGSFSLDFSGKTVSVDRCRMRVGDSEIEVQGELEGWRRVKGRLDVHAEFLDPEDFLSDLEGASSPPRLVPERLNVRLEIHGRTAHWKGLRFGPLRAEVHLRDGEIRLARSRIRLAHGVLTSSGRMRGGAAPMISLTHHVRLTAQPVPELLGALNVDSPFRKGNLNMEAFLTMQGRSRKELLPSLSGNAQVVIEDGVTRQTGVFSRVLEMTSLQKVFKGKPAEVPEGGFYFEHMKGFAVINQGVLSTENFTMSSPIYNAVAAGEANLVERTVHFTLGIQPLETLDTIVATIPIIGYALTGKDRSFLTYYFEVEGPMSDPSTRHVPFKHLGGGVAGVLKRLFLSPVRLYDSLSGGTEPPRPPTPSKNGDP